MSPSTAGRSYCSWRSFRITSRRGGPVDALVIGEIPQDPDLLRRAERLDPDERILGRLFLVVGERPALAGAGTPPFSPKFTVPSLRMASRMRRSMNHADLTVTPSVGDGGFRASARATRPSWEPRFFSPYQGSKSRLPVAMTGSENPQVRHTASLSMARRLPFSHLPNRRDSFPPQYSLSPCVVPAQNTLHPTQMPSPLARA